MKLNAKNSEQIDLSMGLFDSARLSEYVKLNGISINQKVSNFDKPRSYQLFGTEYQVAQPITFTPYASAAPCSARCWFCSENLKVGDQGLSAASLRPTSEYQNLLSDVLNNLNSVPMGLSLSGLEISDDLDWLLSTVETINHWTHSGGNWQEKAAYTNAAGMADNERRLTIVNALQILGTERVEVSRHHYNAETNQKIMNFRFNESIQNEDVFGTAFEHINENLPVSLVCIVQRNGISTAEEVEEYINWASRLGVKKIIFRELSEVPKYYKNNRTFRGIILDRVSIESIVEKWIREERAEIEGVTDGYYYWNINFRYQQMQITFERSDYSMMNSKHDSSTLHKLVFFANGNLCSGWNPEKNIIYQARNL